MGRLLLGRAAMWAAKGLLQVRLGDRCEGAPPRSRCTQAMQRR